MIRNPYINGKSQAVARAWERGFAGLAIPLWPAEDERRAFNEGRAMRATLALSQSNTPLRHPRATTGSVR